MTRIPQLSSHSPGHPPPPPPPPPPPLRLPPITILRSRRPSQLLPLESLCDQLGFWISTAMSTAPSNFHEINSPEEFQETLSADLSRVSLINFWAPWAEPCKQMNEVVLELARKYSQLLVLQVEAESQADISESFEIEAVPSFIILRVRRFETCRAHVLIGAYSLRL